MRLSGNICDLRYLKHVFIAAVIVSCLSCLLTKTMRNGIEQNTEYVDNTQSVTAVSDYASDLYGQKEHSEFINTSVAPVNLDYNMSTCSKNSAFNILGPHVLELHIEIVNCSVIWIRSMRLTIAEKIKLFNTVLTLQTQNLYEQEKGRERMTKSTLIKHFGDKTRQKGGFIKDISIFQMLEASQYITSVYISPTSTIPNDSYTAFSQADYVSNAVIQDYFPCTASGSVLEWSQRNSYASETCFENLNLLQAPSPHMDPRFYSYHAWRHNYRSRAQGYGKHTSFSVDWNINCANCTQVPNVVTFAHIIRNVVVFLPATVYQIDDKIKLLPLQCKLINGNYPLYGHISRMTRGSGIASKSIVLSIANQWQGDKNRWSIYHTLGESLTKLAIYVDFLAANPHVAIHVKEKIPAIKIRDLVRNYWKLNNEIVYGTIFAKVLILPEGNPCFQPGYLNLQMTQQLLANNMDLHSTTPDSILYIQRTVTRKIKEENDILDFLRQLAQRYNIKLLIFSDSQVPSFYETAHLFHRSLLTIGAHGAGLTNILFATQRTAVFEIVCEVSPATFMHMCHKLGLRHHAFFGTRIGYDRCDGGIALNARLSEFKSKAETVLNSVLNDPYISSEHFQHVER